MPWRNCESAVELEENDFFLPKQCCLEEIDDFSSWLDFFFWGCGGGGTSFGQPKSREWGVLFGREVLLSACLVLTLTDGTESLGTEGANGDRFGDGAISADVQPPEEALSLFPN